MKKIISISIVILVLSLPVTFAASLTYDENGNLITGDGLYREYDSFNHLVRVRAGNTATSPLIVNYTWHPTEDRVLIKDVYFNGTINETVYYVSQSFVRVVNSSGTFDFTYVYQNEQLVGQVNPDGSKLYMHDDHLGSTSLITNQSGATVEETFYDPFGGIVSGGATSRFNYEAKEYDPVTSDTDFHARKSKPQWAGMFTQPDSLISNVYDPQSLNHYALKKNNPYNYKDPNGHNTVAPGYTAEPGDYIETFSRYAAILSYQSFRRAEAREELYNQLLVKYYQSHPEAAPQFETIYTCLGCNVQPPTAVAPTLEELELDSLEQNLGVVLKENGEIYAYTFNGNGPYTIKYFLEEGYSRSAVEKVSEQKRQQAVSSLTFSQWSETKEGKAAYEKMKEAIFRQVEEAREQRNSGS